MEYSVILQVDVCWVSPGPFVWHYTDIVGIFLNHLQKFWNTHYELLTDTMIISVGLPWLVWNIERNVAPLHEEGGLARHSCYFCIVSISSLKVLVPLSLSPVHEWSIHSQGAFPFLLSYLFLVSLSSSLLPFLHLSLFSFLHFSSLLVYHLFLNNLFSSFLKNFSSFHSPLSPDAHLLLLLSNLFLI